MKLLKRRTRALLLGAAGAAALAGPAGATSNTSAAEDWRIDPTLEYKGTVPTFDGTARLWVNFADGGGYSCSGNLLAGGQYLLTAAHCASGATSMAIAFGLYDGGALETRSASAFFVHPGWNGDPNNGADIALVRLDTPVLDLHGYALSTTNDVGREILITGYGNTDTGWNPQGSAAGDWNYGHYGWNTIDVDANTMFAAWDPSQVVTNPYGLVYVSDFDAWTDADGAVIPDLARYNTLQRMADLRGTQAWHSDLALGDREASVVSGDSGGGDFVWDPASGTWLLTAVHSWNWNPCVEYGIEPNCQYQNGNDGSYGTLLGSTAVFTHLAWIESIAGHSVAAVPEPGAWALMALGLGVLLQRRSGGMRR